MSKQLKAVFETGDVVEYIGERKRWDGDMKPFFEKGMRFEIIETVEPYKGRGYVGMDEDGEPVIDSNKDGYNVYKLNGQRTILWPKDKQEWEKLQ